MNRDSQKKKYNVKNVGNEAETGRERKYKFWKKCS